MTNFPRTFFCRKEASDGSAPGERPLDPEDGGAGHGEDAERNPDSMIGKTVLGSPGKEGGGGGKDGGTGEKRKKRKKRKRKKRKRKKEEKEEESYSTEEEEEEEGEGEGSEEEDVV